MVRRLIVSLLFISGCATSSMHDDSRNPAGYTDGVDIVVHNGDVNSFTPPADRGNPIIDPDKYDVVVLGAGLAGLSSALFLTDAGKTVLLIEKEADVGGVASWTSDSESQYDRGAAYWTDPYEEETQILNRIGLANYEEKYPIPEPIDSYYVRGQYFAGIWDPETLKKLPSSFSVFKFELQRLIDANAIPDQPIEEAVKYGKTLDLDQVSSKQWIESMPGTLEKFIAGDPSAKNYADGKAILERYKQEFGDKSNGMVGVVELLDLYCRSALGGNAADISAVALANFYESEIITRYTSNKGTAIAGVMMFNELKTKPKLFAYHTSSAVTKVANAHGGVDVWYNSSGKLHKVHGSYAVFSSQIKLAPTLIHDFKKKAPAQAKMIASIGFTHYTVDNVHVQGQPYRAAYDTWTRPADYSEDDFTDVILGQWMDPRMTGYIGYRDFKKDPPVADGVFTIYHGLPPKWSGQDYTVDQAKAIARRDTERLGDIYTKLPPDLWQGPFRVTSIETSRWPISIHTVRPGYFTNVVKVIRRPFGHIFFAHSNLGTPAFEEALFRGHCAADNVLKKMDPNFQLESWTRCPID